MSSKTDKSDSHPRGGRLARRARSFKEDFFGKISQIRGPNMPRSSSPQKGHHHTQSEQSGKHKTSKNQDEVDGKKNKDVNCVFNHVNQLTKSLTYLQDVIKKDKLEMLSGSATVALETVLAIYTTLCNCSPAIKDQSPELKAATNQVFQSLAELIRWSDEIFLCQNTVPNKENMGEVVNAVQEAVKALVKLSMEKQPVIPKEAVRNSNGTAQNGIYSPKTDNTQSDTLPLTPREKEILKETNFTTEPGNFQPNSSHNSSLPLRNSHSTKPSLHHSNSSDSILSSTHPSNRNGELSPTLLGKVVPPPKPPLPSERNPLNSSQSVDSAAPPLPPKKRTGSSGDRSLKASQCHSITSSMCSASLETTNLSNISLTTSTNNSAASSCLASLNTFFPEIRRNPNSPQNALDWLTNGFQDPFVNNENSMESNLNHSADDLLLMKNPSNSIFHHRTKFQNESLNATTASFKTMDVIDSGSKTISYSSTSYSSRKLMQATSSHQTFTSIVGGSNSSDNLLKKMQSNSLDTSTDEIFSNTSPSSPPPALPVKQRMGRNRTPSQYDNLVPEINLPNENVNGHCTMNRENSRCGHLTHSQSMFNYPQCFSTSVSSCLLANGTAIGSQSGNTLCWRYAQEQQQQQQQRTLHSGSCNILDDKRPPLPPKKKPVMAYMEMFGSSQPSDGEFYRHSLHSYNKVVQAQWQQAGMAFMQQQQYQQSSSFQSFSGVSLGPSGGGFVSSSDDSSVFSESRSSQGSWGDQSMLCLSASSAGNFSAILDDESKQTEVENNKALTPVTPPALPPKKNRASSGKLEIIVAPPVEEPSQPSPNSQQPTQQQSGQSDYVQLSPIAVPTSESQFWSKESQELVEQGPLDELDVTHHLILKKQEEEGPDVRGGSTDALVIHAANPPRTDFSFQEAFLTTYRTFVSPEDLIQKLLYRYNRFIHLSDMRQRAARNAFSLLVRVVDDLCLGDMSDSLLRSLMDFIFQLVSHGELNVAKALRQRVIEKCEAKNKSLTASPLLSSLGVTTHQGLLVDFKSEHLAEQMTLLDANLFQKIEIPELLLWAQEQKEELSPNLTTFTEHFNKMSYWARSRILERDEAKDRERYVVKFIKIMKHLRKLNNFNSYLAILSALDSAPIRRLEWQRNITEGLKEYCALIDSSSSFRAYRQALAETEAPCIPYIGLILQDLTFVHIGNNNSLPDGNVNFSKRWQQFNILENMRRFRNCQYSFKKDEHILTFFNNFDDYLCEEAMWQISESIKPRGGGANANTGSKK